MFYTKLYKYKAKSVSCKGLTHCNLSDRVCLRSFNVLDTGFIIYITSSKTMYLMSDYTEYSISIHKDGDSCQDLTRFRSDPRKPVPISK